MSSSLIETVVFPLRLAEQLTEYCISQARQEACGLLFGYCGESTVTATRVQVMNNVSLTPEDHFAFDPKEWVSVLFQFHHVDLHAAGNEGIIGIFHSHPHDEAVPSAADMELSWDFPTYAIVSLEKENPSIRCYRPRQGEQWREQRIMIRNGLNGHTAHPDS
jgi:[CysO sulfur-carrier protein]-S-L-cysteine hydrolase